MPLAILTLLTMAGILSLLRLPGKLTKVMENEILTSTLCSHQLRPSELAPFLHTHAGPQVVQASFSFLSAPTSAMSLRLYPPSKLLLILQNPIENSSGPPPDIRPPPNLFLAQASAPLLQESLSCVTLACLCVCKTENSPKQKWGLFQKCLSLLIC